LAILGQGIFGDVAIEKVEAHPADFDAPDLEPDLTGRKLDRNLEIITRGVANRDHREREEIVDRIALLLPAIGVQVLTEVAVLIEQTDADQRNGAIAGGLQVVAGEDAEATRVDWEALGEAVFGGEVGDQGFASRFD